MTDTDLLALLPMIAAGMTDAEIGAELRVTPAMAKYRTAKLRDLLAARNRAHAIAIAVRDGLLDLDADPTDPVAVTRAALLTADQLAAIRLLAAGLTQTQAAARLGITPQSVSARLAGAAARLGTNTPAQTIVECHRSGLLHRDTHHAQTVRAEVAARHHSTCALLRAPACDCTAPADVLDDCRIETVPVDGRTTYVRVLGSTPFTDEDRAHLGEIATAAVRHFDRQQGAGQ